MRVLGIDSSGLVAAAALVDDGRLTADYRIDHKKTHSQTLLPMISEIMRMSECDPGSLDLIAVAAGPGSFTGLRIGASTAKGLAYAGDIPIVPVSTLEALAWQLCDNEGIVCPVMDARRGQAYTALYRMQPVWKSTDGADSVMIEELSPRAADMGDVIERINALGERTIFIGDGIPVFAQLIAGKTEVPYRCAPPWRNRQSAAALAYLGERKYMKGVSETADTFAPVYLRASQAEREAGEAGNVTYRRMTAKDAAPAAALERDTLGREAWSEAQLKEAADRSDSMYIMAESGGRHVAHAGIRDVCGIGELGNVCVHPDFRRRGIGRELVSRLINPGEGLCEGDVTLEVRYKNEAAFMLYRKCGFEEEGVRPGFYADPSDDARIMWLRRHRDA